MFPKPQDPNMAVVIVALKLSYSINDRGRCKEGVHVEASGRRPGSEKNCMVGSVSYPRGGKVSAPVIKMSTSPKDITSGVSAYIRENG